MNAEVNMQRESQYLELNNKFLQEAETLLEKGDYVQASEKFWGASAQMVKAVAARRGIELRSHGELYRFVQQLREELQDPELSRLFSIASALHQNFYENWLPGGTVVDNAEAIRELMRRLGALL